MNDMNLAPWPEVDPPVGVKKNPRAGKRETWILLLTVLVAGGVTALSAGRSEVLPVICFLALVALPFAGPVIARLGYGAGGVAAREVYRATSGEVKVDEAGCMTRILGPYQKMEIPDEIDGVRIVSASERLFAGRRGLSFVHLPQGLTQIPQGMFRECDNLPAIVIPPQVKSIGSCAFQGCAELKDVYIPASVEEIAPDAFRDCGTVLMHVRPGSAAETYAREKGFLCSFS